MNTLRQRMIDEMNLAGLAASTQKTYLGAVDQLAVHTWRSLEEIPEQVVQEYLLALRDQGAARGSFKIAWFGIRFLYHHVLGRNWALFTKKRSDNPVRSACPVSSPMDKSCPF